MLPKFVPRLAFTLKIPKSVFPNSFIKSSRMSLSLRSKSITILSCMSPIVKDFRPSNNLFTAIARLKNVSEVVL